jgi:alginate O-acetyltransferase complex protein AlgI
MGALSYTFQIYFDFSGYSDMAIGLGLMMGFRFPENFNNPYTAVSITDFWRRWHITLGAWMRNYLYIPLGGNRVGKLRLYFNLWVVFLLSGLWHGAAWGYVIWGAWHGFFLVLERLFLGKWLQKLGRAAFIYTFGVALVGWVFFRIEYFHGSIEFLHRMFSWHPDNKLWIPDTEYWTILALAAFFSFFAVPDLGKHISEKIFRADYSLRLHVIMAFTSVVLCIISAAHITVSSFNPFIYFRF